VVVAQNAQATEQGMSNTEILLFVVLGLVLVVAVLILVVAFYLINIVKVVLLEEKKEVESEVAVAKAKAESKQSWWNKLMSKATDSVPVEEEDKVMLDHEYDGIKELDNHLPPWWKWLFYFTIGWSAVYLLVYHVFDVFPLMEEEYRIEIEVAEAVRQERMKLAENVIDENNVEFTEDPAHLANGEAIYNRECAACHRPDGGGQIGPNLTDAYWIHGGSMKNIFYTVKYGVPQKGMISWQSKLSPTDMRDVSSYIMTLYGADPPNPKAPEGELYTPEPEGGDELQEATEADSAAVAMK
jgi:cytochrome c oxidase cbb3-type subunit 3